MDKEKSIHSVMTQPLEERITYQICLLADLNGEKKVLTKYLSRVNENIERADKYLKELTKEK